MDALIAKCRWLIYLIGSWLPAERAWNLACTQAAKAAQTGAAGPFTLPVFVPPALPALPAGVTVQDAGALTYLFDKIAEFKENDNCGEALCADLRIHGPVAGAPDFATLAPKLSLKISGNKVELDWGWEGYAKFLDQCELQVDRGNGWQILTFDTTPGYTDSTPFPATLSQWKYRGIFRVDDEQVGLWSPVESIAVGG